MSSFGNQKSSISSSSISKNTGGGYVGKGCNGKYKTPSGNLKDCKNEIHGYKFQRGRMGTSKRINYCEEHFNKFKPKNWEKNPLWFLIKNNKKNQILVCQKESCYSKGYEKIDETPYCLKHYNQLITNI